MKFKRIGNYLKMNCTKASRVNTISTEKEHFIEQLIRYYEEGGNLNI